MARWLLTMLVAACGSFTAKPIPDGGPPPPNAFRISGTATSIDVSGATTVANATIAAYRDTTPDPIASAQSADTGAFTIEILAAGEPIDFLRATAMGFKDTYLYPATPLDADFAAANPVLLTPQAFDLVDTLANVTQQPGNGWIALEIVDPNLIPIAGAIAEATGGDIRYNGSNGLPASGSTSTQMDGMAYVFNAPIGPVSVGATVQGMPLRTHTIEVRADLVTMAYVAP